MTTQITEYSATEAALIDLASRFKGVVYDVTTKEGMAAAKTGRNELRGYRTSLEAKRVEIKAPALERCRLIDAEAKRITAELEALEDPIAAQIKIEEDKIAAEKAAKEVAERAKIEAIHAGINAIRQKPVEAFSFDADHTQRELDLLQSLVVDEAAFGIFRADAQQAKDTSIAQLTTMLETKRQQEAEALRLKSEREAIEKKQAEQAELEAEHNRKREAEEREARAKIEEEERQSRLRIEEQERQARLVREEEERQARLKREAEEAEARKVREAEEARQREIQRKENMKLDGREMLISFTDQYGNVEEFSGVVKAINQYFSELKKAAA